MEKEAYFYPEALFGYPPQNPRRIKAVQKNLA